MKKAILALLAVLVVIAAAFAANYYRTYYRPNSVANDADIYVYANGSYEAFLDTLLGKGVLKDGKTFTKAAAKLGLAGVQDTTT